MPDAMRKPFIFILCNHALNTDLKNLQNNINIFLISKQQNTSRVQKQCNTNNPDRPRFPKHRMHLLNFNANTLSHDISPILELLYWVTNW